MNASLCIPKDYCGLAGIDLVPNLRGLLLRGHYGRLSVPLLSTNATASSRARKPATRTDTSRIAARSNLAAGGWLLACLSDESRFRSDSTFIGRLAGDVGG